MDKSSHISKNKHVVYLMQFYCGKTIDDAMWHDNHLILVGCSEICANIFVVKCDGGVKLTATVIVIGMLAVFEVEVGHCISVLSCI